MIDIAKLERHLTDKVRMVQTECKDPEFRRLADHEFMNCRNPDVSVIVTEFDKYCGCIVVRTRFNREEHKFIHQLTEDQFLALTWDKIEALATFVNKVNDDNRFNVNWIEKLMSC